MKCRYVGGKYMHFMTANTWFEFKSGEFRWYPLCTRRRGVRVSWFGLKTKVDGFSRFGLKISGLRSLGLCLKTGSYGLMIWASNHCDGFLVLASKQSWLWFVSCAKKLMGG
jgi:hypothetical protein